MKNDNPEPWRDPGPTWKEIQGSVQWRPSSLLITGLVIALYLASWYQEDPSVPLFWGSILIAVVCIVFVSWRAGLAVLASVWLPLGIIKFLQMLVLSEFDDLDL